MPTTNVQIFTRDPDGDRDSVVPVTTLDPLPVQIQNTSADPGIVMGRLVETDWVLLNYGATVGAVDANDALGDLFRIDVPERGRILSIKMLDLDDDTLAATIHIFSRTVTAAASDAASTFSDPDGESWVASELFDAGTDLGAFKAHVIKDVNVDYVSTSRYLYAQLSTTGTPNIADQTVMPRVKLFIQPMA